MVKSTQDARLMDKNVEETEEEQTDDFLLDVVCFTCPYLDQCGQGQEYNSVTCIWMRDWLSASIQRWQEEYEYVEESEGEED
jgi:hypothetical protein